MIKLIQYQIEFLSLTFLKKALGFVLGGKGAGIAGPLISGLFGSKGAKEANSAAAARATAQMQFQKMMSDTSHQRNVADLKAAGLNPVLSARYGGASTPQGAMAPVLNEAQAGIDAANQTSNSAVARRQVRLQEQKLEAEIANIEADTAGKHSQSKLNDQQRYRVDHEIDNLIADTFAKTESGNLRIRDNQLRILDLKIRSMDVQEKRYLLEQIEMDMKILRNDSGNVIKKLRLLKGVNSGVAALTAGNEAKNKLMDTFQRMKKSIMDSSPQGERPILNGITDSIMSKIFGKNKLPKSARDRLNKRGK